MRVREGALFAVGAESQRADVDFMPRDLQNIAAQSARKNPSTNRPNFLVGNRPILSVGHRPMFSVLFS